MPCVNGKIHEENIVKRQVPIFQVDEIDFAFEPGTHQVILAVRQSDEIYAETVACASAEVGVLSEKKSDRLSLMT